jgi:hypothetical protein
MRTRTLIILPILDYRFFREQVEHIGRYFGPPIAIKALRTEGSLTARMLALALTVHHRRQNSTRFLDRLADVVATDPSEEACAVFDLLPRRAIARAQKRAELTARSVHSDTLDSVP